MAKLKRGKRGPYRKNKAKLDSPTPRAVRGSKNNSKDLEGIERIKDYIHTVPARQSTEYQKLNVDSLLINEALKIPVGHALYPHVARAVLKANTESNGKRFYSKLTLRNADKEITHMVIKRTA